MSEPTEDRFLGGRLSLLQLPRGAGYRAGIDAVLLAAAIPAQAGDHVLDMGCGVGAAMLCLHARVPGLRLMGLEKEPVYADLARRNAVKAGADATVVEGDLRQMPSDVRQHQFSHVLMNPPYFVAGGGSASPAAPREMARGGDARMVDWIDAGVRRLAPKGSFTLIQNMARLPEVMAALDARLGSLVLCPIQSRGGKPPGLFVLQGRAAGRSPFRMLPPLMMHTGESHERDTESYTPQLRAILRDAAPLPLCD